MLSICLVLLHHTRPWTICDQNYVYHLEIYIFLEFFFVYVIASKITFKGCLIIIRTGILLYTPKTIAPRAKSQAWGQNNWSRALKWGIVRLCSSSTFWDTTVFMKMWVFQFLRFCKKMMISLYKNAKNAKTWKSDTFYSLSYLQYFLSYRDVLYLILKLLTNCFDL